MSASSAIASLPDQPGARIIPLRQPTTTGTSSGDALRDNLRRALADPFVIDQLQRVVEQSALQATVNTAISTGLAEDAPLGPVYLFDLQPDFVERADVERVRRLSHVVDLSDQISFQDSWDD